MMHDETMKFLHEYREVIVPAVLTASGLMARRWRIERRFRKRMERLCAEFEPNGGGSVRDKIHDLSDRMVAVEKRTEVLCTSIEQGQALQRAYMSLSTGDDVAFFQCDHAGGLTMIDAVFQMWTGKALDSISGHRWIVVIAEVDRDRVIREWNLAVEHGADWRCEYNLFRHDRSLMPVVGRAIAMHDANGEVVGYLGTVQQAIMSQGN